MPSKSRSDIFLSVSALCSRRFSSSQEFAQNWALKETCPLTLLFATRIPSLICLCLSSRLPRGSGLGAARLRDDIVEAVEVDGGGDDNDNDGDGDGRKSNR